MKENKWLKPNQISKQMSNINDNKMLSHSHLQINKEKRKKLLKLEEERIENEHKIQNNKTRKIYK